MIKSGNREERGAMQSRAEKPKTYIAIDLKSFYASVECVERQLNPLTKKLLLADFGRSYFRL